MSQGLERAATSGAVSITGAAATPKEIRDRVNAIQRVMASVMSEGVHYGKIPGCGDKPALFKPGAEKLLMTFGVFVTEPMIFDLGQDGERRVRVVLHGKTADGTIVGTGVGECSSNEKKYRWRRVVCPEEWKDTPEAQRNKKWKADGTFDEQVRANPADIANTILKMAKKRAMVDLTLTSLAASDCFEQDLEEDDHPGRERAPRGNSSPSSSSAGGTHVGAIKSVERKKQESKYTIYTVMADDGTTFDTFKEDVAVALRDKAGTGEVMEITYTSGKFGNKLVSYRAAPAPESAPEPDVQPDAKAEEPADTTPDNSAALAKVKAAKDAAGVSWEQVQDIAKSCSFSSLQSRKWTGEECATAVEILGSTDRLKDILGAGWDGGGQ